MIFKIVLPLFMITIITVITKGHVASDFKQNAGYEATSVEIDKKLRITAPLYGKNVRGNIWIRGNAKPGSSVLIKVKRTYFELQKDTRRKKFLKGEGPLTLPEMQTTVKTNGQGIWQTNQFNLRNTEWSTSFKIVATSKEGKNSTYVVVKDETKPIVEWD